MSFAAIRPLLGLLAVVLAALLSAGCGRPAAPVLTPDDIELVEERVVLGRTVPFGHVAGVLRIRARSAGATITQVSPSCGCTISDAALPVTLGPGEVFEAPIAMDLSRLTRGGVPEGGGSPTPVERDVIIASQRGGKLVAKVVAELSDRITLDPAQVRLGTVALGTTGQSQVRVGSPSGTAPRVLSVTTGRKDLTATVETDASSGGPLILLRWSPAAEEDLESSIRLAFDDPAEPSLTIPVQGRAAALVTAEPQRIENLAASISRPVVVTISVRRADELPLEILGVTSTSHRVQVEVLPGLGAVRLVRVVVPVLPPPAETTGAVVIRTDAPVGGVLEIPIRVRGG